MYKYLVVFGLLVSLAFAHDWAELNNPEFTQERLEQLISFAETLHAELPADLASGQTGRNWLNWLENSLGLSSREQQALLSERLNQSLYTLEEDAFLLWQHEMEHMILVYDASTQVFDQVVISTELESLDPDSENAYLRAAELSYLLMLSEVSHADKALLEPFLPRLASLIRQAGGNQ